MEIVKRNEFHSTTWSGGVTTELAIGPEGSDYASRHFGWRISTATVNSGESEFTKLPGVYRHLMVLSGALELTFESAQEDRTLGPFNQVSFDGSQKVVGRCKNSVVDFNLMLGENYFGQLEAVTVEKETTLANIGQFLYMYVVEGSLTNPLLNIGDLGITQEATIHLEGNAKVVVAYVDSYL
jgi:environmental stress-induced protein Ves